MPKLPKNLKSSLGPVPALEPAIALFPKQLSISIGGYFGPGYSVELEKGRLTYTHWPRRLSSSEQPEPQREQIQPSARQWQAFRKALDRLNVWCWQTLIQTRVSAMARVGAQKSFTPINESNLAVAIASRTTTAPLLASWPKATTLLSTNSVTPSLSWSGENSSRAGGLVLSLGLPFGLKAGDVARRLLGGQLDRAMR
jgi:hypothetical protein